MIRRLSLPILASLISLSACDGAPQPTEPDATTDALFDVTTEGLVTNTLQIAAKCNAGVTGRVLYTLAPAGTTFGLNCPKQVRTHPAVGITGFQVLFDIDEAPGACDGANFFPIVDFTSRTKCTVNGLDVGGKPMATVVMKYVKD